jgi:crotonobetainyl-CoA:carnitine CoA-transferase CaiB-like acyl-CoA transferase
VTGLSSFAGLRVVELGVWVAAPAAGAMLADWGADVIKVEPPSSRAGAAPTAERVAVGSTCPVTTATSSG